jgi:4-hydroxyphenylacetate decarboxylase small subunit
MSKANLNHGDCQNFIPIDVAKGFCIAHDKEIMFDGDVCPNFTALAKCKNCVNFTDVDEKSIGCCRGFKDSYWAYANLKAGHCEAYHTK